MARVSICRMVAAVTVVAPARAATIVKFFIADLKVDSVGCGWMLMSMLDVIDCSLLLDAEVTAR